MKIVIFGGTSEGRLLSNELAKAGADVVVSVASDLGVEEQGAVLVADQEAGGDGVGPDAAAREVGGQPLGKVADACLGSGISRDLGQRRIGVHRGNV